MKKKKVHKVVVHNVVNFVKKNLNLLIFCINCRWSIVFLNLFSKVFSGWGGIVQWGGECVWWCGKNGRHFRVGEVPPLFIFNPDFGDCQLAGVVVILPPLLLCR